MRPIDPKQVSLLVHPLDAALPTEDQSVWHLRGLTLRERAYVQSQGARLIGAGAIAEEQKFELRTGDAQRWRVKFGLVGVDNFPGYMRERGPLDGAMVAADSFLDTVPDPVIVWADEQIRRLTDVSVEDAGKS